MKTGPIQYSKQVLSEKFLLDKICTFLDVVPDVVNLSNASQTLSTLSKNEFIWRNFNSRWELPKVDGELRTTFIKNYKLGQAQRHYCAIDNFLLEKEKTLNISEIKLGLDFFESIEKTLNTLISFLPTRHSSKLLEMLETIRSVMDICKESLDPVEV